MQQKSFVGLALVLYCVLLSGCQKLKDITPSPTDVCHLESADFALYSYENHSETPMWVNGSIPTSDGGCLLFGSVPKGLYGSEGCLLRTDAEGAKVWQKQMAGLDLTLKAGFALDNGNFILTGTARKDNLAGHTLAWLAEISEHGEIVWQKQYGETDRSLYPYKIFPAPGGGLLLIASTKSFHASIHYLLRMDSQGEKISGRFVGSLTGQTISTALLLDDGSVVIAGKVPIGEAFHEYAGTLTKIGPDDQVLWEKRFDHLLTNVFNSMTKEAFGNIVIAGKIWDHEYPPYSPFILKVDADGNQIWDKILHRAGLVEGQTVAVKPNGQLLVLSKSPYVPFYPIVRLFSAEGDSLAERHLESLGGPLFTPKGFARTTDGELAIYGQQSDPARNVFLMRLACDGEQ